MGEYNNEEFNEEQDDMETRLYEKDESDEEVLENKFEPYDEEQQVVKGFFDTYVPKDEQECNIEQFETEFIPKDEKVLKKLSSKEVDKEKEAYSKEKVHNLKDKKLKLDENDSLENQLKNLSLKEYIQEQDKKDLEFKENPNGKLKESEELAEMVCIGLGDGTIPHNKQEYTITLNKSQEPQYAIYVYELMKKTLNKRPRIIEPKKADAIRLSIGRKKIIEGLIDKGHTPGDKKKNQVEVPQWIIGKGEFQKHGLGGLVDTDGSIHIHKHNKTLHISFNNASYPLVEDFKNMCEANDINTVKISPVKGKSTYTTGMESKGEVSKFIDKVKPKKWEHRAKTFGLVLKSISDPKKRVKIEKELHETYTDKRVNYSFEYRDLLKKLCIKHGYDVSNESLIKEIEKMLTYSDNYTGITKEKKKKLNFYAKNIIDDLKKKWMIND